MFSVLTGSQVNLENEEENTVFNKGEWLLRLVIYITQLIVHHSSAAAVTKNTCRCKQGTGLEDQVWQPLL